MATREPNEGPDVFPALLKGEKSWDDAPAAASDALERGGAKPSEGGRPFEERRSPHTLNRIRRFAHSRSGRTIIVAPMLGAAGWLIYKRHDWTSGR